MADSIEALVFSSCLVVGAAVAVSRGLGWTAVVMLVSSLVLFALTGWAVLMFEFRVGVGHAAEWFPFDTISRICQVLFGLSFVLFAVRCCRGGSHVI
jgi:hypothetical protein